MSKSFQIAIDGPVAAGCSTVARLVAERLGILYIDTGAMYRTAALLAMRNNIDLDDASKVAELVEKSKIELLNPSLSEQDGRLVTVLLNGEDISWRIRTEEIGKKTPVVAKHSELRKVLVKKQQEMAVKNDVIMEGRDITYRVLPAAELKIFLTASEEVRAGRRYIQKQSRGRNTTFEKTHQDLLKRDKLDMGRSIDPLKIVEDATVIDTSNLTIDQVVDKIVSLAADVKKENSSS